MQKRKNIISFQGSSDWEDLLRSEEGTWLDEVDDELAPALVKAWEKLPIGGFLGGPLWGCGFLDDDRFVSDSRTQIEDFRASISDGSERFLGQGEWPCWMIFKRSARKERVLLISGCDQKQMNFFGKLTQRNHEHYACLLYTSPSPRD